MTTQTVRATLLAAALVGLVGCGSSSPPSTEPSAGGATDGEAGVAEGDTVGSGHEASAIGAPTTLARADITGRSLAQDEKRLYFAGPPLADAGGEYYGPDGDLVWSVEKSGGHPQQLFPTPAGPVADVAVDRGVVFFSVGGTLLLSAEGDMTSSKFRKGQIMRTAAGGGKPKVVAKNQVEPKAVAADGGHVFWFADDEGTQGTASVRRAAAGGGKVKNVVKGATAPGEVAVAGKHLLWLSTGEDPDTGWTTHLWRANRDGGAKKKLATLEGEPRAVVADETTVYVATAGIIAAVPIDGGDPLIIVDDSRQPQGLAVDGERIYWTTRESQQVLSAPKQGGEIQVLARNQTEVGGIAVDESTIYWTVSSAIRKLRKPGSDDSPPSLPAGATEGGTSSSDESPDDPFAPVAEEEPAPSVELGPDPEKGKVDPDNLPDKWLKCKRHAQCVLIETGCCLLVSVNKKSKKKARKALPHSTCDAECSYENITARCEDKLCRAVLSPTP